MSLAGSWGVSEVLGWGHSLNDPISRANARFYAVYAATHLVGAAIVLASVDLVRLAVDVEVVNALLIPVTLGLLLALEARALPAAHRMRGARRVVTTGLCLVVMAFGVYTLPLILGL